MRVLHIIHSVDPRSGGPSHALRGLVQAQVARGHRVTLVATTAQSAEPWAPRDDFVRCMQADPAFQGVDLVLGRAWGRHRPWSRFSYCPHTVRSLAARLADPHHRPEVMHIHGQFSHLTIRAAQLARRRRVPYIVRPAGSFDAACLDKGMARWKRVFLELFHRRDLRRAAAVHVTSQAEADQLNRLVPGCRLAIIPHGVAVPNEPPREARDDFLRRYRQLSGKRVVLFLSRLHEIKRPEWLLEAFQRLRPEMPRLGLLLAGPDAGAGQRLRVLAQAAGLNGEVLFPGFLQGAEKAAALAVADAFALPSQHENFGVAVIEAMAHGVPVVVTPGVAAHEYVDASGCGLTVEDNLDAFTEGLRRVLRADRQELGRRGRQYVAKHLTWPAIAAQVDELYHSVGQAPRA